MEVVTNSYMPGDPRLVEQLVYELKSQGIFDQFRKECIADVDTKPAYQNLRQRVEGSVTSFLSQQTWRPDMNKNQVREQLRKNIYESGYLETGVERIVDQVVNPKINSIFLPQVEDVVYRYLGLEKPNRQDVKKELKIDVTDLLPTDLEAISPESDHTKDDSLNFNDSMNSGSKMEEDESPPFEPIDVQNSNIPQEENSVDSHLSGFSGLQSHDSNPCMDTKICQMELSNQDSQISQNSSESRLSIITSEDNTKMEIREDSDSKILRSSDSNSQIESPLKTQPTFEPNSIPKDDVLKAVAETDSNSDNIAFDEKNLKKQEDEKESEIKEPEITTDIAKKKPVDEKQNDDKKYNERKSDEKKEKRDKYSSKDKKDDKYKKSSSSSSREKEKSNSKYSSSSSKDRTKSKDRKESKNSSSSSNKDKERNEKDNYKNEKDKEKIKTDKERDKSEKDKDKKDRYEKDKSEKNKSSKEKEKSSKEKDKTKSSSSSNGSSGSKHNSSREKEKEKSSTSLKSDSSKRDKEKSYVSSSSSSKDKSKSSHSDSKSKSSSSDKHKKDDKSAHVKHSSSSSSSSKRDRDKKKNPKKDVKDDHYSSKDKKNDRRSTDRDSNDGRSGRQSQVNSFTESSSSQAPKSSQESSNSNSGSGSGDSGNSDQNEHVIKSPIKTVELSKDLPTVCLDTQKFKYAKPKFASNFQEARKLMKIRKQLAKLERHNQLSLAQIEVPTEVPLVNGINCIEKVATSEIVEDKNVGNVEVESVVVENSLDEPKSVKILPEDNPLLLQSRELSKENWEALEARLAQEMSTVNYNSYESPYDDYDYNGGNSVTTSPKKSPSNVKEKCVAEKVVEKIVEPKPDKPEVRIDDIVIMLPKIKTEFISQKEISNTPEEVQKHASGNVTPVTVEDDTEKITDNEKIDSTKVINETPENKNTNTESEDIIEIKTSETLESNTNTTKMDIDAEDKVENVENAPSSDTDQCFYLEPLSPALQKNLQFLYRYIEKLEQDVKHSLKTFHNNFVPLKERYGKRKLTQNVDLRNNNKAHYEQSADVKKRRRSAPNPNSVISKANKEKLCNSSDISPNDSFSLPLSPAESDKSNEKKEEDSPKAKQKRESIGKGVNTRNQRYSSEDLYKPRPIFMGSRRSRGAKNLGK